MKFRVTHSCAGVQYAFSKGQIVDADKEPKKAQFVALNLVPYGQAEVIKEEKTERKTSTVQNRKAKTTRTRKKTK
jgi:hypothetical protein